MKNNHKQIFTWHYYRAGTLFLPASLSVCWRDCTASAVPVCCVLFFFFAGIPLHTLDGLFMIAVVTATNFLHLLACGPESHLACRSCALNFHYE